MEFSAKAKFLRYSPEKLRTLVDVVRGKDVDYALGWLTTFKIQRAVPVKKIIESAAANAKSLKSIDIENLYIKDIRVDRGPIFKYFKPGAMGRANPQRKRLSHISVILSEKNIG